MTDKKLDSTALRGNISKALEGINNTAPPHLLDPSSHRHSILLAEPDETLRRHLSAYLASEVRMKLSKKLSKLHAEALALVRAGRPLTLPEREFVLAHYHEGAEHMNGLAGAFFTPAGLARDLSLEVPRCRRILDLCAGIGALADACLSIGELWDPPPEVVCVELNPAYVEAGRAAVPGATWVCASAFNVALYERLGPFDVVVSNPPFGRIRAESYDFEGRYTGGLFEYRLIELASRISRYGVFIIPQESAPFRYSGRSDFESREQDERPRKFQEETKIALRPSCGIDTAYYRDKWRGTSPKCEIVLCDFEDDFVLDGTGPRAYT